MEAEEVEEPKEHHRQERATCSPLVMAICCLQEKEIKKEALHKTKESNQQENREEHREEHRVVLQQEIKEEQLIPCLCIPLLHPLIV